MAVTCRILEPQGDPRRDVETLALNVGSLIDGFWKKSGRAWYGPAEWSVQALPMAQLWLDRSMVIISASEDGKPAGFLMGIHLGPLFTSQKAFHVEAYYGVTPEAEKAILDFLKDAFRFFEDRQLVLPRYDENDAPVLEDVNWKVHARTTEVYAR
jgi:hypothetical protein